jgi:hypothetical protein
MSQSWENLNFVEHYIEHNKRYESPNSFWLWSAYAAISAVCRDNCYRRMGDSKLYPNMYILFLADSSFHRKNRPIETAEKFVRHLHNTKIISGRASIQAVLQELSKVETDNKTGKMIRGGSAIFFAPELAAGIVSDPTAIGVLTDIYECREQYDRLLVSGKSNIKNLVFSFFAASNASLLKQVYTTDANQGGLLARTYLIVPDEFRDPNSLLEISVAEYKQIEDSKKSLQDKLQKISEMKGELNVTQDAIQEYNKWYNPFRKGHAKTRDKTGVLGRIHTSILKLAIVLALNENSFEITRYHIGKAIDDCMALVPNYNSLTIGGSNISMKEIGQAVIDDLLNATDYCLSRRQIFQKHLLEFDIITFDNLIKALEEGGMVKLIVGQGTDISYMLTPKAIEILGGKK